MLQLPRLGCRARHVDAHLPALRREREPQRQPGPVLAEHRLPRLHGPGDALRHAVPGVPRDRERAEGAQRQGAHPGRRRGRAAHPGQGTWRARPGHGASGRPLRGRPRRQARGLRPQRPQPDHDGAGHLSRGRAGDDDHRAHPRRQGHLEGPAGDPVRPRAARARAAASRVARGATAPRRATSWSRSTCWCRRS